MQSVADYLEVGTGLLHLDAGSKAAKGLDEESAALVVPVGLGVVADHSVHGHRYEDCRFETDIEAVERGRRDADNREGLAVD